MSVTEIPPREPFAKAARDLIEMHDKWDSPHQFVTLHWDGEKLDPWTVAVVMPDIDPGDYPRMLLKIASDEHKQHPGDPAYAYALQIEAFGVAEPAKDATYEEKMRYQADRLGRTFHQRADAREMASAYVADVHGRLWAATKYRGADGIEEHFYPPGPHQLGGRLIGGLLAAAHATGMLAYGLPGPGMLLN